MARNCQASSCQPQRERHGLAREGRKNRSCQFRLSVPSVVENMRPHSIAVGLAKLEIRHIRSTECQNHMLEGHTRSTKLSHAFGCGVYYHSRGSPLLLLSPTQIGGVQEPSIFHDTCFGVGNRTAPVFIFGDASGGKDTSDPRLRRVGIGLISLVWLMA